MNKVFRSVNQMYDSYSLKGEFTFSASKDAPFLYIVVASAKLGPKESADFIKKHHEFFNEVIESGHGLLFKNLDVNNVREYDSVSKSFSRKIERYNGAKVRNPSGSIEYHYKPTSTPRTRKNFLHNEVAYQRDIPSGILFFCEKKASIGGESLLGDQTKVWEDIPEKYQRKLLEKKLRFDRVLVNQTRLHKYITDHLDQFATFPSWQHNLQTNSQKVAEEKCRGQGFKIHWSKTNDLILTSVIDPVKIHPSLGKTAWCTNGHLFTLHPEVYGRAMYTIGKLYQKLSNKPMSYCYYGDGEPLEKELVESILAATTKHEKEYLMEKGEVIYLNNHVIGHGRNVFRGERALYFTLFK